MSKKVDRKIKRIQANKAKKNFKKDIKKKVSLFGCLPEACTACQSTFDKTDKKQVASWSVVVRQSPKKVHLYCPTCWQSALEVVDDFRSMLEKKKKKGALNDK